MVKHATMEKNKYGSGGDIEGGEGGGGGEGVGGGGGGGGEEEGGGTAMFRIAISLLHLINVILMLWKSLSE